MSIALITGANRGLGLHAARLLAEQGHTVIAAARDPEKARQALLPAIQAGHPIHPIALDVTDPASITAAAQSIEANFGHLDLLINNAAILLDWATSPLDLDPAKLRTTFATNLEGVIHVTRAHLPLLCKGTDARIINVSSAWGSIGGMISTATGTAQEYAPTYQLSKTALNALTVMLAAQLRPHNITVNAVSPGWCRTDMGSAAAERSAEDGAKTILHYALQTPPAPTGGFFGQDGPLPW